MISGDRTYCDGFGDCVYFAAPSNLSFLVFAAVWSIIIVLWQVLTPRYAERLAHRFVILGLDAITMIFWFAGFIALAVYTPALPAGYTYSSYSTQQACVAFAAFAWYVLHLLPYLQTHPAFGLEMDCELGELR